VPVESEDASAPPKARSYDVDEADAFWTAHAGDQFPEVLNAVPKAIEDFEKRRTEMAGSGQQEDALAPGLAAAINALPEMTEKKRSIDMHTNIAHALVAEVKARELDRYYEFEDQLASQSLGTSVKELEQLLGSSQKGTLADKLRAIMVLVLTKPTVTQQQLQSVVEEGADDSPLSEQEDAANSPVFDPELASVEHHTTNGSVKLERMIGHLVDEEILRGIPLRPSLRGGGIRWWFRDGAPLSKCEATPVDKFDTFISHTWQTNGRWKVLSLTYQTSWQVVLAVQVSSILGVLLLGIGGILPLPWVTALDTAGVATEYPMGPWMRWVNFPAMLLGLFLAPYLPERRPRTAFVDMLCINQEDEEQRQRGIDGISGFLKVSRELRILWSVPYLSRLWCVFELGAFRRANPSGKITLAPLFIEQLLFWMVFGQTVITNVYFLADISLANPQGVFALALLAGYPLVHTLRRNLLAKHRLFFQLEHFDLDRASCSREEDRDSIYAAIKEWYGGEKRFVNFVRGPLRDELADVSDPLYHPGYCAILVTPAICAGLDDFVSMWRGGASHEALASHFCASVLAFQLVWILMASRLALYFCDRYAAAASRSRDYFISLLIFILSVVVYLSGLFAARAAKSTLLWSLGWLGAAVAVAGITSFTVRQASAAAAAASAASTR
ncbi:SCFD1, partial [Symbiodinium sp. KB8]